MALIRSLFELRGKMATQTKTLLEIMGGVMILTLWAFISAVEWVPNTILPPPHKVLLSFRELHFKDALIVNALYSIKLNVLGYLEALSVALPLGFLIGLLPICRGISERYVAMMRYLPLTAVMGLFIAWFGIGMNMKVQFLAFGIFVYLLPVIAQRVDEVQQIYVDTVKTLGASRWQTVKSVFIPDVLSRVSDDVRVLIAISWTYIIIAEVINSSEGGIGALVYMAGRQSQED